MIGWEVTAIGGTGLNLNLASHSLIKAIVRDANGDPLCLVQDVKIAELIVAAPTLLLEVVRMANAGGIRETDADWKNLLAQIQHHLADCYGRKLTALRVDEVKEALAKYDVRSIETIGREHVVVIGCIAKDRQRTRTFKATSWKTIIRQVKERFG